MDIYEVLKERSGLKDLLSFLRRPFIVSLMGAAVLGFGLFHLTHDKLIHFVTFMVLTIELWFVFDGKRSAGRKIRLVVVAVVASASVVLEYAQSVINPSRVFDVYDIVYNVAGLVVGIVVCVVYGVVSSWRERPSYRPLSDIDDDYVEILMRDVDPERELSEPV
ncbi:uncharacterized protein CANTADRAFT_7387 [Suhomyces tanzawaensis NRRL Y-17324]|uniref:VanZ-like domain-containing protein n=1 Tax=Suhomyces tanzawaensis NRRL Y-17324 TaxID=984487 RepID=A0A1E4SEG5_9ASCO|nr:uncharacterized protein CANTADRAFT_7387 [Suhomyces tanzawaensis NRRL Y-17324]ODV77911.1 hypothetical protein CANTADRAFT_7387 [Suhomyces tanzawaensis NRRL Y-17324]